MREENGLILSNTCIAKDTYKMMIQAEMAKDMQPGQSRLFPAPSNQH